MNWKIWLSGFLKVLWAVLLISFLVVSGWLLHILEAIAGSAVKNKKGFNKKAIGAGSVASLVASPIRKYSRKGRKTIRKHLSGHYPPYGAYVSRIV